MNLHGIVSSAIGAVNPLRTISMRQSTGFTQSAAFKRVPTYGPILTGLAQIQPIGSQELQQLANQNISGNLKSIYLNGTWDAVVRADLKGGDIFTFDNHVWLAVSQAEDYPDWTRIIVQLQIDKTVNEMFGFEEAGDAEPFGSGVLNS